MALSSISITVNGEAKEVEATTTGVELFADDKDIIAVRLNGELRDLCTPLSDGDAVEPVAIDSEDGLGIMRHSATHVMAQAVQELFPNVKLGVGPIIKDGFYYDFQVDEPFTPDDLKAIEKHMQRIVKSAQSFRRRVVTEEEALKEEADQPFKIELIEDKEAHLDPSTATEVSGKELSFYDNVDRDGNVVWKDLCRGPHLPNTRFIKAFKIERSAAAYWRGSEKNPTMQRIYGTAWATKEDLKAYQTRLEEAAKRDHRKLGAEMDLFSFPEEIGPGLAVFHPKGAAVINAMEDYSREMHRKHHYSFVQTPHITKGGLYETSGHLHWYKDGMYPAMRLDEEKDENGNELKDANGNRILDEEADYSGYFRDIQWKNKTITELYYPGSVFKVITSAMGVDSGLANINTTFTCAGAYGVAKETYHCAGHKAHGTITLAEALRQSCNIYYIQLGQRVGSQTFYNYFDAFGFTSRTGVDLPSETGFMQYYKANQLGEVQLASSAFGQAMAITPLQMCTAVAAAVNGGYLVTPHVVDKITDANGNVIEEIGANVRRQVISESTSNVIRQFMEYEVGNGTGGGKYAYVSGYRIGGKSGTSEQLNMDRRADGDYKKVASFAAVLPADDPEIIVYVMLDDPNNARTDYSSLLAAPVVGNIISEIAPYLGIAADGEDRSQTVVTVPNLVGTEWSSAQVQLNIKGLRHQLAESTASQAAAAVTYQYPHAGAKVAYGTTVYLYTDTYEGGHTDVPDVTGKSADFARQMLSAAGLNCVVEGNANGTVQAQSADPGSSVQRGTVVTITCG